MKGVRSEASPRTGQLQVVAQRASDCGLLPSLPSLPPKSVRRHVMAWMLRGSAPPRALSFVAMYLVEAEGLRALSRVLLERVVWFWRVPGPSNNPITTVKADECTSRKNLERSYTLFNPFGFSHIPDSHYSVLTIQ